MIQKCEKNVNFVDIYHFKPSGTVYPDHEALTSATPIQLPPTQPQSIYVPEYQKPLIESLAKESANIPQTERAQPTYIGIAKEPVIDVLESREPTAEITKSETEWKDPTYVVAEIAKEPVFQVVEPRVVDVTRTETERMQPAYTVAEIPREAVVAGSSDAPLVELPHQYVPYPSFRLQSNLEDMLKNVEEKCD